MQTKLNGKIAIVTGSDSGIGQGIAEEFARQGADIMVVYLHDRSGAAETRQKVEAAGRRAIVSHTDVRDEHGVAKLFEETERKLGAPYILVNNAGVGASGASVADTTTEEWENVLKTDLYGPFFCCRQFIHKRREAGGHGKIINITSVHEEIPSPGNAAYGAAKGGLRNLTRSLALELAPDRINVVNIAPGLVRTPMTQHRIDDPQAQRSISLNIPWRRAAEPWEIGRLAAYLASEDADYITGQTITIDGGLEMNWGQGV
jgi:glucose 1-dehydrogenase